MANNLKEFDKELQKAIHNARKTMAKIKKEIEEKGCVHA